MNKLEELDQKLLDLRERWKQEPGNRKIIEIQARAIKSAIDKYIEDSKHLTEDIRLQNQAKEIIYEDDNSSKTS